MKVDEFFNTKAENYAVSRATGILRHHIEKEKNCVLGLLDIKKGEQILDAGCGDGYYSVLIKKAGATPFGIDISEKMISSLGKYGISGKVADLENFNLDVKFDKVLCAGSLEFLNSPEAALVNFNKHLKDGGSVVILYPKKSLGGFLYKLYHKTHGINIKLFSHSEIVKLLEAAKFFAIYDKNANSVCNSASAKKI